MKTHLKEMVFEKAERDDDDDDDDHGTNIREVYHLQKDFDNWIINWLTDTASLQSFYCPMNVT